MNDKADDKPAGRPDDKPGDKRADAVKASLKEALGKVTGDRALEARGADEKKPPRIRGRAEPAKDRAAARGKPEPGEPDEPGT